MCHNYVTKFYGERTHSGKTKPEKYTFGLKAILNVEEPLGYTGIKKCYIYKLVHSNSIPFSKPNGKVLFFERKKIDEWLLKNSHKSNDEIQQEAIEFSLSKR